MSPLWSTGQSGFVAILPRLVCPGRILRYEAVRSPALPGVPVSSPPNRPIALSLPEVARLRSETPGTLDHVHFNNAGASLPPRSVLDRQIAHLRLEARIGGYQAARTMADALEEVRADIGRLVGAAPDEVAFHQSATDAWNTAVVGFLQQTGAGDCVLVDEAVYGSHALTLLHQKRLRDIEVCIVRSDPSGTLDLRDLARQLERKRVRLVCLTHIPTSSGLVNPVAAAGAICAERGVDLVVDACQSVGQWPVDVKAIQCSALSATGRKFLRGPRGTGFLVVRRSAFPRFVPIAPDLEAARWTAPDQYALVDSARRYESWEHNVAALLGLGEAVRLALGLGVERLQHRIQHLARLLRRELACLHGVTVHDRGAELCGICTCGVQGRSADAVAGWLQTRGVTVSVTRVGSARLELEPRGLEAVVRASVHAFNTESEVLHLVEAVRSLP